MRLCGRRDVRAVIVGVTMYSGLSESVTIDFRMTQLFALVSEALAGATDALLGNDRARGLRVVEGDQSVDELTAEVELMVWKQIDDESTPSATLRHLVGVLLIVPELERSGDLAEHIAQRAVTNLGSKMSPLSRGIIQRMAEVALEMWHDAADAYGDRCRQSGRRSPKRTRRSTSCMSASPRRSRPRRCPRPSAPKSRSWPASTSGWAIMPSTWPGGSRCCTAPA